MKLRNKLIKAVVLDNQLKAKFLYMQTTKNQILIRLDT